MANGPREHDYYRGVASVPQRRRPATGDTADLPRVDPPYPTLPEGGNLPDRSPPVRRAAELPRGLVVRRRGRRLRAGAGWSWAGGAFVLVCWGIWLVSLRGGDLLGPLLALLVVLATGVLLFVAARLLGRAVLERTLGRQRPGAWPSHLTVCGFLAVAGIAFLQQTRWVVGSVRSAGDLWRSLLDLLPL